MARKKIIHLNSKVSGSIPVVIGADGLQYGEIAIQYLKGEEAILFRNDQDEIVTVKTGGGDLTNYVPYDIDGLSVTSKVGGALRVPLNNVPMDVAKVVDGNLEIGSAGAPTKILVPQNGRVTVKEPNNTEHTLAYITDISGEIDLSSLVLKSGDTMTGPLRLTVEPSTDLDATNKLYVDTQVATKATDTAVVHLAGAETITGVKTFNASPIVPTPTTSTQVTNKQYVDNYISGLSTTYVALSGSTMRGALLLNADPMAALEAATKQYVDVKIAADLTNYVAKSGGAMTGGLTLNANPTTDLGAATKQYVDTAITNIANNVLKFVGFISTTAPTIDVKEGNLWYSGTTTNITFPWNVYTYSGGTWVTGTTTPYTPNALDGWSVLSDNSGWYYFGGHWNRLDFAGSAFNATQFETISNVVNLRAGGISDAQIADNANIAQSKISGLTASLADNVKLSGDQTINGVKTFGTLPILTTAPTGNTQAANKQYVDNAVMKSGATMTGPLVLNADPTAALGAATKQYVDTAVNNNGNDFVPYLPDGSVPAKEGGAFVGRNPKQEVIDIARLTEVTVSNALSLLDVKTGDDLSGKQVFFNGEQPISVSSYVTQYISFTNNHSLTFSLGSGNPNDDSIYINQPSDVIYIYSNNQWNQQTYTFPDNSVVSTIMNMADGTATLSDNGFNSDSWKPSMAKIGTDIVVTQVDLASATNHTNIRSNNRPTISIPDPTAPEDPNRNSLYHVAYQEELPLVTRTNVTDKFVFTPAVTDAKVFLEEDGTGKPMIHIFIKDVSGAQSPLTITPQSGYGSYYDFTGDNGITVWGKNLVSKSSGGYDITITPETDLQQSIITIPPEVKDVDISYFLGQTTDPKGYIEFEVDSTSGTFIVPFSQRAADNQEYSIRVYVNNELHGLATGRTNYTNGTGYQINNLTGSTAVIKLQPTIHQVGWGRAFGFYANTTGANAAANKNKLLRVLNDPDYAHLLSETSTGDYFRYCQYSNCSNLIQIPDEDLPDTVTSIGVQFRSNQYYNCGGLTGSPAVEVIPSGVTSIGAQFRSNQYEGCTKLTGSPAVEVLPSGVTSIGDYFRNSQYYNCGGLTGSPAVEVIPSGVTSIGNYFRVQQYSGCTSLTGSPAAEVIPSGVTSIGNNFRDSQYYGCSGLTGSPAAEVIPSGVTSIGSSFRYQQYQGCPNIRISGHTHDYRFATLLNQNSGNYQYMFNLSSSNTTTDYVPKYYIDNTNTTTTPVTDLTPTAQKYYLTNRTGIPNYNSLNANWK
jgi:hypothetical protein